MAEAKNVSDNFSAEELAAIAERAKKSAASIPTPSSRKKKTGRKEKIREKRKDPLYVTPELQKEIDRRPWVEKTLNDIRTVIGPDDCITLTNVYEPHSTKPYEGTWIRLEDGLTGNDPEFFVPEEGGRYADLHFNPEDCTDKMCMVVRVLKERASVPVTLEGYMDRWGLDIDEVPRSAKAFVNAVISKHPDCFIGVTDITENKR